jgi:hypothetical protein
MSSLQHIRDNLYNYQGLNDVEEYVNIDFLVVKKKRIRLIPDFYHHLKQLENSGDIQILTKGVEL